MNRASMEMDSIAQRKVTSAHFLMSEEPVSISAMYNSALEQLHNYRKERGGQSSVYELAL